MTPLINVFVRWHICRISSCLAWGCFTILIFVCVRVDKKIKWYISINICSLIYFFTKKSRLVATLIPLTNSLELQWETDVQTFGLCTSIRRCTLNQSRLFAPGKQSRFFLFWIGMLPYLRKKQLRRLKSVNTSCAVQTAMTGGHWPHGPQAKRKRAK